MKESRRAKRMSRHHSRRSDRTASLNMVSLMDIFTILVFFLLVNASSSEILPTPKAIKLPESIAEKPPKENIVIMVNNTDISLQGKTVASVSSVMADKGNLISPLALPLSCFDSHNSLLPGSYVVMKESNVIICPSGVLMVQRDRLSSMTSMFSIMGMKCWKLSKSAQ